MKSFWKGLLGLAVVAGLTFGTAMLLMTVPALAGGEMPTPKMPAEFDQLKTLLGTWKGKADMGKGKPMVFKNTYELTSGGTAILERISKGTPHEMVSVYCAEGNKILMTHYCTAGNQPKMTLKSAKDGVFVFEMQGNAGVPHAKDMHMHAMTLTLKDKDHLTEDWTMYVDGKPQHHGIFEMTRVK